MDREELVERMAIAVAGLSWVGSSTAFREILRRDMRAALAVAEPAVRAEERERIEAAFSHINDWGVEEHDRIIAAIRSRGGAE